MSVRSVVDAHAEVGEGPVWDGVEGVLWWTDINGHLMHRYDPRSGVDETFAMPFRVGCFALREQAGFVLAAEHGFWFWQPGSDPVHIIDVEADRPDNRMNDGGCDRAGNLVAASMHLPSPREARGACWRLNRDLTVDCLADGLHIGNGIAFSPAGDRFYLADTTVGRVWVHPYDPSTGAVGDRTDFVDFEPLAGLPDGATVDSEGCYWIASVGGGRVYRFLPDGQVDRTIALPTSKPTRPAFGGPGLDRLYITSIGANPGPDEPDAGNLFVTESVGVTGLPEPRFGG